MSDLPFPEAASTDTPYDEPAITSEQLLRKEVAQRFGSSGTYRDLPFAVLFLLQLCTVIVIALVNGLTLGQSSPPAVPGAPAPPASPPDVSGSDVARSHELLVMLMVASILSGVLTALWLVLLRAGARVFVFAGAVGGCVVGVANAGWLLAQGNAAGLTLGLGALALTAAAAAFLAFNRHRVEFSVVLLATVAQLMRDYPATVALAVAGWGLQLLWLMVWCTAFAFTSLQRHQASTLCLLLFALLWTTQLIKAVIHTAVAGTVASWYFLSPHVPRRPTARALRRALTTSFGSPREARGLRSGSPSAAALPRPPEGR